MKARYYRSAKREGLKTQHNAGLYANHGKSCSCAMCGNPRRHFGEKTIQERRALDEHNANKGVYDGDTDSPCVWHCTDDDIDQPCEAL